MKKKLCHRSIPLLGQNQIQRKTSCILDLSIRTVLLDRIEDWLLTYPYVRSRLHLNELERENTGIY